MKKPPVTGQSGEPPDRTCVTLSVVTESGKRSLEISRESSILEALRSMELSVPAICGGRGSCGKCGIRVLEGELPVTDADIAHFSGDELKAGHRLSCKAYPIGDITVEASFRRESGLAAITDFQPGKTAGFSLRTQKLALEKTSDSFATQVRQDADFRPDLRTLKACSRLAAEGAKEAYVTWDSGRIVHIGTSPPVLYGVGIDIGTTTLGFALVDLREGAVKGRLSVINGQREYGADVISRIMKASDGSLDLLSGIIRGQISQGIRELCDTHNIDCSNIVKVAVAGNTTMLHLLLGLSCDTLGSYPFTPVTLDYLSIPYGELFEGGLDADVHILPGLSTYVGADITSGILFSRLLGSKTTAILLDIGTNGEMVVSRGGKLICTSTAAGPAFEGGNILWGTGSVPGAISEVRRAGEGFDVTTIGDRPPIGICGSGVIDAVYVGLQSGLIDPSGRMSAGGMKLAADPSGRDIVFTQKDVRELQMGKSAIRSGLDMLMKVSGASCEEVGVLYVAGGFGYRVNFESAVGIGMIPENLRDKVVLLGNSSLGGAVMFLLDSGCVDTLTEITGACEEFRLSEDEEFQDVFIENMSIKKSKQMEVIS